MTLQVEPWSCMYWASPQLSSAPSWANQTLRLPGSTSSLDEATSASPEAVQLLTEGYRRHLAGDPSAAVPYYQRAAEMDPDFAMAHAALAAAYDTLREPALAAASATKAYELRTRLTEPGRFNAE